MTRAYETLLVGSGPGAACTITLNRPQQRNAIGPVMVNELLYALGDAFDDASVRTVVLTGAGSAFCAGADLGQMTQAPAPQLPLRGDYADLLLAMTGAPKPIVARVNGHALGAGLGLVAASTFAIASTDATLGTPEVRRGLFPMMIMALLMRLMSRRRLLEMMLLGQRLTAQEAQAAGLINRAVPASELDEAVATVCGELEQASPMAVRLGLQAFADQDDLPLEQALPRLRDRLAQCLATEDAAEGLSAFMQKRTPRWPGR